MHVYALYSNIITPPSVVKPVRKVVFLAFLEAHGFGAARARHLLWVHIARVRVVE
jgi:hypothetical protein